MTEQHKQEPTQPTAELDASKPGDPISKSGWKLLPPTNVGVHAIGLQSICSGEPHVQVTYVVHGDDPDASPGLVHKGTFSVAVVVTVHDCSHGWEACHRVNCKEAKDYGDVGTSSGSLSVDGDCAATTEDAIILGKLTEEIHFTSTVQVDAMTAGSTALSDCTEAGQGGETCVSDETVECHGPFMVVTAMTEEAAERSHNCLANGWTATDDDSKCVTDVHHVQHGAKLRPVAGEFTRVVFVRPGRGRKSY